MLKYFRWDMRSFFADVPDDDGSPFLTTDDSIKLVFHRQFVSWPATGDLRDDESTVANPCGFPIADGAIAPVPLSRLKYAALEPRATDMARGCGYGLRLPCMAANGVPLADAAVLG